MRRREEKQAPKELLQVGVRWWELVGKGAARKHGTQALHLDYIAQGAAAGGCALVGVGGKGGGMQTWRHCTSTTSLKELLQVGKVHVGMT